MKLYATFDFTVTRGQESCSFTAKEQPQNISLIEMQEAKEENPLAMLRDQYKKILPTFLSVKGLTREDGSEYSIEEFKELDLPDGLLIGIITEYHKKRNSLYTKEDPEKKQ